MNSRLCWNHFTGQPRCAQFTANTWKVPPDMLRTHAAVPLVAPSLGFAPGTLNFARRVSPSG